MKNIKISICALALALVAFAGAPVLAIAEAPGAAQPAQSSQSATTTPGDNIKSTSVSETVTVAEEVDEVEIENSETLQALSFGHNMLFATNDTVNNATISGIMFSFGNKMDMESISEYSFVAGNFINYSARTKKDAFIAGNIVKIKEGTVAGGDIYVAANEVIVDTNLTGNLSVAASKLTLKDTVINGDLNVAVGKLEMQGDVLINGVVTYNKDAELINFESTNYGAISSYDAPVVENESTSNVWLNKAMSVVSLFIIVGAILWLLPASREKIMSANVFKDITKNLATGAIFMFVVPVIVIALLITIVGVPASLMLLAIYILMMFIAQAVAAAWLGHFIVEDIAHSKLSVALEALIGVVLYGCVTLIPGISGLITFVAILLGSGIIINGLRGNKENAKEAPKAVEKPASVKKPAKNVAKKTTKK